MLCEQFGTCAFHKNGKTDFSTRQYTTLVFSYCEGALQQKCKRAKWRIEKNEEPPDALTPSGYLSGCAIKFYE